MSDPIQPTPSPLPQTPVAPVLPNPQEMVDAALSGDTSTPKTEMAEAPKTETLPPLAPLMSPEQPVVAPPTDPVPAPEPVLPPIPEPLAPAAGTTNVTMGDDTPLAFAGASMSPASPATQSPLDSPIPPATPPVPPVAPTPKKKGKLGKIFVGVTALLFAVVGGVWGYMNMTKNYAMVALVGYPSNYCGTRGCPSGTSCKNNQCVADPKPPSGGGGGGGDSCSSGQTRCSGNSVEVCSGGNWHGSNCTYGCASGACKPNPNPPPTTSGGGGDIPPNPPAPGSGLFGSINPDGGIAGTYPCGNNQLCLVDSPGTLEAAAAYCAAQADGCDHLNFRPTDQNSIDQAIAANGNSSCLPTDTGCPESCSTKAGANTMTIDTQEPGGGSYCNAKGEKCSRYRIEKMNSTGGHCFVSYGEQCGGSCGGDNTPPPSAPPGTPTMKCDGLTSVPTTTPTAPTIGTKLTFTCAGTVTPASAGTLSYKFRYSINSGTPVDLTPLTATPNKAELTINACGTYKVQCQACATLAGVLTCDPTWTAATQ